MKKLFLIAPVLMACPALAQFSVGSGATFYIASGTQVAIDGLTLLPSADLTLSGVTITTSPTPLTSPVTIARVYDFTSPVNFTGTLGILYADGELNGLTEASLKVGTRAGTGASFATSESSTMDADANYLSAVYASAVSLGQVTALQAGNPLPVTLVAFTAVKQEQSVFLTWQTANETDFSRFGIERSTDANNWGQIGEVTAKDSGAGLTGYSFTDPFALHALPFAYYRLKMVDLDGTYVYSHIASVAWEGAEPTLLAYPNPAADHLRIEVPAIGRLVLYDAPGRRIREAPLQPGVNVVDVSRLPAGMYFGVVNGKTIRWIKN